MEAEGRRSCQRNAKSVRRYEAVKAQWFAHRQKPKFIYSEHVLSVLNVPYSVPEYLRSTPAMETRYRTE